MIDEIVQRLEWWTFGMFFTRGVTNPLCDFCSKFLDEYPAVIIGRNPEYDDSGYAACKSCREMHCINPGDTEYFEDLAYNAGVEPRRPGLNFGGRRR